jgi:hypothetical protein
MGWEGVLIVLAAGVIGGLYGLFIWMKNNKK